MRCGPKVQSFSLLLACGCPVGWGSVLQKAHSQLVCCFQVNGKTVIDEECTEDSVPGQGKPDDIHHGPSTSMIFLFYVCVCVFNL